MVDEPLSICLFGSYLIRRYGRPVQLGIRGTTLQLLRYLVVSSGREIRREFIADQFWRHSSECRQRSALNSAIWRIGKILPDHSGIHLHVADSTICFEIGSDIPVDTRALTDLVHEGSGPDAMNGCVAMRLSAALDASEAPFMDGLVEEWVLSERERISNIRLRGLTMLMHWFGDRGCYEDALEVGRKLLEVDPFREAAQIDMMWLYVLNRQRAQGLKQYQTYADLLHRELGIEPMMETRALYDHIRCGLNCSPQALQFTAASTSNRTLEGNKLDTMLVTIEQSRRQFYQTLRAQID